MGNVFGLSSSQSSTYHLVKPHEDDALIEDTLPNSQGVYMTPKHYSTRSWWNALFVLVMCLLTALISWWMLPRRVVWQTQNEVSLRNEQQTTVLSICDTHPEKPAATTMPFSSWQLQLSVRDPCAELPCAWFTFESEVPGDRYGMAQYYVWIINEQPSNISDVQQADSVPTRLIPAVIQPSGALGQYKVTFVCYPMCLHFRVHVQLAFDHVDPFFPSEDPMPFVGRMHSRSPFVFDNFTVPLGGVLKADIASRIAIESATHCVDGEAEGEWRLDATTSVSLVYRWHSYTCYRHHYDVKEASSLMLNMNHRRIVIVGDSVSSWWAAVLAQRLGAATVERDKARDHAQLASTDLEIHTWQLRDSNITLHYLAATRDLDKLTDLLTSFSSHISLLVANFGLHSLAGAAEKPGHYNRFMESPLAYQHKIQNLLLLLQATNMTSRTIWRNIAVVTPSANSTAFGNGVQSRRSAPYIDLYNSVARSVLSTEVSIQILDWHQMTSSGNEVCPDQLHWQGESANNHNSVDVFFDLARTVTANLGLEQTARQNLQVLIDARAAEQKQVMSAAAAPTITKSISVNTATARVDIAPAGANVTAAENDKNDHELKIKSFAFSQQQVQFRFEPTCCHCR